MSSDKHKKKSGTKNTSKETKSAWNTKLIQPNKSLTLSKLVTIFLIIAVGIIILVYFYVPFSHNEIHNEDITYKTDNIQDSSLELGESQTRQNGINGTNEITIRISKTLSGRKYKKSIVSERIVKSPVNKTIATGTKKYQFMLCSNGTYRFYSSEEFKNPNTGFTHKSKDYCAENGQGHMTGLADSAPAAPQTVYVPRNTTPTYTSPSYNPRTCNTTFHDSTYFDDTASTTCY